MSYTISKIRRSGSGLSTAQGTVKLGGALTADTVIDGAGSYNLSATDLLNHEVVATQSVKLEAPSLFLKLADYASKASKYLRFTSAGSGELEAVDLPETHPAYEITVDNNSATSINNVAQTASLNLTGTKGVSAFAYDSNTSTATITLNDATALDIDLSVLAVDKFLANASYDAPTRSLVLSVNDGDGGALPDITVPLADLVPAESDGVTVMGDGTSADKFKAGALTEVSTGVYRWTAANGAEITINIPDVVGAESGVNKNANGKVRLGGTLLEDVTVDGSSNTYFAKFVNLLEWVVTATDAAIRGAVTEVKATTTMKFITPLVAASGNSVRTGYGLYLKDRDTGEVEFGRPIQVRGLLDCVVGSGTSSFTALDTHGYVFVDTTVGPASINLPDGGASVIVITVKKASSDANGVTIVPPSGSTVDNMSNYVFGDIDISELGAGAHESRDFVWRPASGGNAGAWFVN